MKRKLTKNILRAAVCLAMVFALVFAEAASVSAFEYTDYGKYPASAAPTRYSVSWSEIEDYNGFEKHDKYFEIKTTVNGGDMSFYITLPSVGGFRMLNTEPIIKNAPSVEDTGIWEPESNSKINYTTIDGGIAMTGLDGTKVIFTEKGSSWRIEVYDDESIRLFAITPAQIFFGYQKGVHVKTKFEMPLAQKEVIYGSGERFSGINLVGKKTVMWNSDAAYHSATRGTGEDGLDPLWRGYKNVPVFHSNRGYTMFYNSYCSAEVDVGYTNSKKYTLDFSDTRLDFYLWTGNTAENLVKYTDLTGKSYLPPKWAFQYQAGGSNGFWLSNGTMDQQIGVAQRLIDSYEEMGTPLNVVYIEGVKTGNTAVYNMLKAAGARLLSWNNADCISVAGAAEYFGDLPSRQLPYARNVKNPIQTVGSWVDYTDPKGIELLKYVKGKTVKWGIVGGMCDFAELVPPNTVFKNGLTGEQMHNFYTYFYAKAYNQVMGELTDDDWFCYIRGASAGAQKWIGTWSGDQHNTWAGLKMQLSAGLSIGTSGFSIWGTDLGGLDGEISNEIYNRALTFCLFMPTMRTGGNKTKLPTEFSAQLQNNFKQSYWLRESLVNKLYSSAIDSHTDGLPMMKAMGLAFPDDLSLYEIEHEYLFCDDFLVSTVFEDGAYYSDNVVLPDGTWYNLWTGKSEKGGKTITDAAPYNQMPVYVKSGAAVPMTLNEKLELGGSMLDVDTVEALLVTPPDFMRSQVYNKDEEKFEAYVSAPTSKDTFRIKSGAGNDAQCLVALGVPAYSVTVDGKKLDKISEKPQNADTVGYYVDSEYRTLVYIGTKDWETVDIQFGIVDNNSQNLVTSFVQDRANAALLNNTSFTDVYAISVVDDSMVTAKLSDNVSIGKLVLKWTAGYPESYNIEVSDDGVNWKLAKAVEQSLGGIEEIELNGVSGRYIRISDVVSLGIAEPSLYGFEVYKGAPIKVNDSGNIFDSDSIVDPDEIEDEYEETVIVKRRRKKKNNATEEWITVLGMPIWLFFIVVGAAAVVLAGVTVFIIIIIKKKKKKEDEPQI